MTDNVDSVERMYADFAQGDIAAVLALLDEQVEWRQAEGNPYRDDAPTTVGHQQVVEQVFARLPQDFDDFHIRVDRVVGLGDTVLAEVRYAAVGKATRLALDVQGAHVWDFKDGKVVRFQQYVDTAQWRAVYGVSN
jgi:uncharacterized protein